MSINIGAISEDNMLHHRRICIHVFLFKGVILGLFRQSKRKIIKSLLSGLSRTFIYINLFCTISIILGVLAIGLWY